MWREMDEHLAYLLERNAVVHRPKIVFMSMSPSAQQPFLSHLRESPQRTSRIHATPPMNREYVHRRSRKKLRPRYRAFAGECHAVAVSPFNARVTVDVTFALVAKPCLSQGRPSLLGVVSNNELNIVDLNIRLTGIAAHIKDKQIHFETMNDVMRSSNITTWDYLRVDAIDMLRRFLLLNEHVSQRSKYIIAFPPRDGKA
jgi:hypothetical protein